MTLEETYYVSQTIAAIAVIASLVYLALQTRQATRSTRAAMHENRVATVLRHIERATDPQSHPIWMKANSAAPDLSDAEIAKYVLEVGGWVVVWEERFRERREGLLDDSRWASSEKTIAAMTRSPGFRAVLALMRPQLDPGLAALLDKHIARGRAAPAGDMPGAWRMAAAKELNWQRRRKPRRLDYDLRREIQHLGQVAHQPRRSAASPLRLRAQLIHDECDRVGDHVRYAFERKAMVVKRP